MPATRITMTLCLWAITHGAWADHRDQPINTARELRDWCKSESDATFIGRGLKPYNWSASYSDQGHVLIAQGQWRIEAATVTEECRVARGTRAEICINGNRGVATAPKPSASRRAG